MLVKLLYLLIMFKRRGSVGYDDVPIEEVHEDGSVHPVHRSSRKKTLGCISLAVAVVALIGVFLFVLFEGIEQEKSDIKNIENKVKNNIVENVFVGGVCGTQSYERYLVVTVNYAGINNSDSDGKPFVSTDKIPPGFLAVVDTDPNSDHYSEIVGKLKLSNNDKCSSQPRRTTQFGNYFIIGDADPEYSDIYVANLKKPKQPKLEHVINGSDIQSMYKLSSPNTIRTMADGTLLVAMMGNSVSGTGKGGFIQLDPADNFKVTRWDSNTTGKDPLNDLRSANYDFWLSPYIQNTMISSEWVPARQQKGKGSVKSDVNDITKSSTYINFWNLKKKEISLRVDLHGESKRNVEAQLLFGYMPLEVRMLHSSKATGYVGVAGGGEVFAFWKVLTVWETLLVISVEPKLDEDNPSDNSKSIPALITDVIISHNDRRLYLANWAHGEIREYDIEDPLKPMLCGTLQVSSGYNKMHGDNSFFNNPETGKDIQGGPARLQLRNDGTELFFTTSFNPGWDNDFYPKLTKQGSFLGKVVIDTCHCNGDSMKLDTEFGVDFGSSSKFPDNPHKLPARAHDIHFVGGDPSTYPNQYVPTPTPLPEHD